MSVAFSVVSWNIKHFKKRQGQSVDAARVNRVVTLLRQMNPDVFAIFEVEGKDVYQEMVTQFPGYTFEITEGPQTQEILIGFRSTFTCFITQKVEFKSGVQYMRPGQLATLRIDGEDYCLVFLHLASFQEPRGFGLRDDMLYKAVKFRHKLDKPAGGKHQAHYIFLGDLNTMGLDYPFEHDISANYELKKWDTRAERYYGMRRLSKTVEMTWRGTVDGDIKTSNLDHVYASTNLIFEKMTKNGVEADVNVLGWVDEPSEAQKEIWNESYSDHSMLYFKVLKVQD